MKTWKIPVSWIDRGTVEVEANTLAEAINSLYERYQCIRPNAKDVCYGDGTFNVDDTEEYIRSFYNADQPDDTSLPPGFAYEGQWITDPSLDPTGRFPLTKEQAKDVYGSANLAAFERSISTNAELASRYQEWLNEQNEKARPAHKPIPPHYRPEVTELCPHCVSEIGVIWNPEEDGYQIHCPRCGTKIMLCSICPMKNRCDWYQNSTGYEHCSMMDKYFKVEVVQTSRKTVFVKAADREEAEEKAYELCPGMDLEYVDETMDVTVDSDYTGHPYTGDGVVIIE